MDDDDMRKLVQAEGDWANRLNGHVFSRQHDLDQVRFLLDLIRRLAPEMYQQAVDNEEAGKYDEPAAPRREDGEL